LGILPFHPKSLLSTSTQKTAQVQAYKSNIWYAGEKKIKSKWKLTVLDDKGRLEITEAELRFFGKRNNIAIQRSGIKGVTLVRQEINWGTYFLANIFFLAYYQVANLSLLSLAVVVVTANVLGLLVSYHTQWVKIDYLDSKQQASSRYFADGGWLGWSGIFGGTGRLLEELSDGIPSNGKP
jgi:hypothetical protein